MEGGGGRVGEIVWFNSSKKDESTSSNSAAATTTRESTAIAYVSRYVYLPYYLEQLSL